MQQICAHRLPSDQLRRTLLHRMWDKRLRISNLEYREHRLRLGELTGNRFHIVLREVQNTEPLGRSLVQSTAYAHTHTSTSIISFCVHLYVGTLHSIIYTSTKII